MALVAIVAMLGTGVAPAAAKAPDESERTTITTFGFVPTDSAGTAAQTDVEAQIAEVESLEASDTPLAAPYDSSKMPSGSAKDRAAMAAGDTAYRIVSTWTDNIAKPIVARAGNGTTWGLTKVQNKHHVNLNMIKKTTKFPRPTGGRVTQGTSIIYLTDAIEWECWIGSCKPKRSMTVKVVIENARMSDGKQKGLITAYCMGVTVCPQWVINVAG
ncbi:MULTISPECIES: hypothetical protein [unclassified Microbacterium]|uniref:hypothetical protein n=1 Tax=unclassified Microbacterium TaxID=2609290 RepID=UPI001656909E|nr:MULTISPECIES: hypothetical protein [unclassified Microbacterium]MCT1365290.1 hypothetical protein [Microbacterium sp. p3-SID131]MCT1376581.1 hypothetical protein [Microbacterium sp. p3-SID337]CAD5140095.1 conserved exported protein of unknown function [Microbacterium sp. Nx66]